MDEMLAHYHAEHGHPVISLLHMERKGSACQVPKYSFPALEQTWGNCLSHIPHFGEWVHAHFEMERIIEFC